MDPLSNNHPHDHLDQQLAPGCVEQRIQHKVNNNLDGDHPKSPRRQTDASPQAISQLVLELTELLSANER